MSTTETSTTPPDELAELGIPSVSFVTEIPKAIAAALVKAQRSAKAVGKSARAEIGKGYSYTPMEDLLMEGRDALNGAGLALIPGNLDVLRFTVGERATVCYTAIRTWVVIHESGAALNVRVSWPMYLQSGKRSRDKALAVADTTMLGYLYRDLLGIPRLGEEQMDARDDRGSTEPGADPSEAGPHAKKPGAKKPAASSSSTPAAPAKPKPKPPTKPAAPAKPKADAKPPAKTDAKTDAKTKPAAKKKAPAKKKAASKSKAKGKGKADAKVNDAQGKAADAEADEAKAEADAEREAIQAAANETAKTGPTPGGKTYGGDDAQGDDDGEAASDDELREALAMGLTPSTTNDALVCKLPPDPSEDDLEGAGWPADVAAELVGFGETQPVDREALNVVTRKAAELMGLTFKQAKPMLVPAFSGVGVELAKKQTPNGYQLRLWCLAVGGIAAAHEEGASV